ncbi:MAG: dUTP diphosphatase [Alphaproteobacteria bacterium]
MIDIYIKRLEHSKDLPLPKFQTDGAAACDLFAAISEPIILKAGEHKIIPTGFAMALPLGYEAQVRPRSGLAAKSAITVLNSPGTIDSDYRGEVGVILINLGTQDFTIEPQSRIAQMLVAPCLKWQWVETDDLEATQRGDGGFGSTGSR